MLRSLVIIGVLAVLSGCEGINDLEGGSTDRLHETKVFVHLELGGYLCRSDCWLEAYTHSPVWGTEYIGTVESDDPWGTSGTLYSDRLVIQSELLYKGVLSADISGRPDTFYNINQLPARDYTNTWE